MKKWRFSALAALAVGAGSEGRAWAEDPPLPPNSAVRAVPEVPPASAPDELPLLVLPPFDPGAAIPAPAPVSAPTFMVSPAPTFMMNPAPVADPTAPSAAPPGAFDALQNLAGCPCEPQPPTPPGLPPYGGPLHERPALFGDLGGARGKLRDHGYTFNVYSTNFYADVANGGLLETAKYRGRMDYLLNVDGEKAGLWKGSFIDLHAETIYGDTINGSTGTLSPPSVAQLVPLPNGSVTALTGVKFTQALSERFLVFAGKINILDGFNQPFTGGARGVDGFWNSGLLLPLTYARTVPYSSLGAGFAVLKGVEPVFTFMVLDANDSTTTSGFNTFFHDGAVMIALLNVPTNFFGLPGHQGLGGSYSSRTYSVLDRLTLVTTLLPGVATPTQSGSWSMSYSFDQALYVDPANPKRSWGTFGNLGLADTDTSPFRYFANIGVGGSSPFAGRKLDSFGVGYYYLGLSNGFKNVAPLRFPLKDEQGVELFYNVGVTPWFHVTPDMQVLFPAQKNANTALFLGLRAKIDF